MNKFKGAAQCRKQRVDLGTQARENEASYLHRCQKDGNKGKHTVAWRG